MVEANEPTGAAQTGGVRAPLLARQRAIVTGRRGGIGSGVARGLRAEGATIVGIGRSDPDGVLEPAGPLRGAVVADLARRGNVPAPSHNRSLGALDILVTAHGHVRSRPAAEVDPDDWDLTFASNLSSVFQLL